MQLRGHERHDGHCRLYLVVFDVCAEKREQEGHEKRLTAKERLFGELQTLFMPTIRFDK